MKSRFFHMLLGTAALVAMSAIPANASSANGELCSVQTTDGSVRVGVHTADPKTSRTATRHQLEGAGGWCTNQVAVRGWMGADKSFDSYSNQYDVCFVSFPGQDITFFLHADADAYASGTAAQMCREIAGNNMRAIYWY
jgi:hypothetical protein